MLTTAYSLFLGILLFAPVALGATHIWAKMAVEAASFLAAFCVIAGSLRQGKPLYRIPAFGWGLAFAGWILFQLIPLSSLLLGLLSPAAHELHATVYGPATPSFWAPLTIKPIFTVQEFFRFSGFLAFFYSTVQLLHDRQRLRQTLTITLALAGLLALHGILQSFAGNGKIFWLIDPGPDAFFGSFFYRNHFAGFMAMLLPVSLSLFLYYRPKFSSGLPLRQKIVHLVDQLKQSPSFRFGLIALLVFTAILLSQSRTGISVAVATTGCMLLFGRKLFRLNRTSPVFIGLVILLAGIIIGTAGIDKMDARFGSLVDEQGLSQQGETVSGRIETWQDCLDIIADFPLTGSGLGTFFAVYPAYKTITSEIPVRQVHNEYLEMATDGGFIAIALIAVFLLLFLRKNYFLYRQRRDSFVRHLYLGTQTGIVALLLHSITDYQFRQTSAVPLYFFFLLGLQTVAVHSRQSSSGRTCLLTRSTLHATVRTLVCAGLIALIPLTILFHSGEMIGLASFDQPVADESDLFNFAPDTDQPTLARWQQQATRATRYDPLNLIYHTAAAYTAQALGQDEAAKQAYITALKLDPVNADTLQLYGEFLSGQGEGDDAQRMLEASVKRDRNARERQLFYAYWLLGQGYVDKGISVAKAMLEHYPDLAEPFLGMLSSSPLPPELIPQTMPDRVAPRIVYAGLLEKSGDLDAAATAYDLALSFADKDDQVKPAAFHQALRFYRQQKDEDRVLAVLQQAVNRLPNDFTLRLQLGDLYTKQGMFRRAAEEYRFALQVKPDDQQALKRLETLQLTLPDQ